MSSPRSPDDSDHQAADPARVLVCSLKTLEGASPQLIPVEGTSVGVWLLGNELRAYEDKCPHLGGPVCLGKVLPRVVGVLDQDRCVVNERFADDEPRLACPWHGYEFDLLTGICPVNPNLRLRRLNAYVADGDVYVEF